MGFVFTNLLVLQEKLRYNM